MVYSLKTDIEAKTLVFKQPAGTSRGIYKTRLVWYVKVMDKLTGISGIGECAPLPNLSCDDLPNYEHLLSRFCRSLEETGIIDYEALRPYPSILFGLESAMLQIKAGGTTSLSSTPFARGEEGITINGLIWMGTFEEMERRIEEKLKSGFHCVKLKIGAIDFDKELSLIKHIRSIYDRSQIELRVDANGGFTPDVAMKRLEELAKYDIHSIEQPIRQHQWNVMAELCKHTPLPIALDEELIGVNTLEEKELLLETIKPQYIILKPSLHGGIKGTKEWMKFSTERGINHWITSALESNVGLNAIAHFCAETYGPDITFPQGLGTGMLFTNNIDMPLQIRGEKLWFCK